MATYTAGNAGTEDLQPGQRLTVTLASGSVALVQRYSGSTLVSSTRLVETKTFGPYFGPMRLAISCITGTVTASVAAVTGEVASESTIGVNVGRDTWIVPLVGEPLTAAQATLSRNPAGNDNALTFTAVKYGAEGNRISIAYVDPAANSQSLAVSVDGYAITVSLATNGGGTITSTAAQVKAAIEASAPAAALVTCTINTADSGSADDGTGVVTALAAANMTGGAGSGVGVYGFGSLILARNDDTDGGVFYNSGTKDAPVWAQLASV